jgi:hypothetical protein
MQTDSDELIHIKLEGELVDGLLMVDTGYGEFVTYENGRSFILNCKRRCMELYRRLCCIVRSCLLFWSARLGLSSTIMIFVSYIS